MRIGSGHYIVLLVLVALCAAAGGVVLDSRPLLWSAIVIGAYALHLVSVHEAATTAENTSPREAERGERSGLDKEREDIERLRSELELKLAGAEEQWTLLRSMVQERVERTASAAPSEPHPELQADTVRHTTTDRTTKSERDQDQSGRAYGRW
jgi:hypothetical protein